MHERDELLMAMSMNVQAIREGIETLIEILCERQDARSSVEVRGTQKGPEVTAKSYGQTVRDAGTSAVAEYLRTRSELLEKVRDAA